MRCGVGRRRGSDLALLWLRCRLAAVALIRPLDWELPYAMSATLKSFKKKKRDLIHNENKIITTFYIVFEEIILIEKYFFSKN